MCYKIQYGQPSNSEKNYIRSTGRKVKVVTLGIILFSALVIGRLLNTKIIREKIIPGDAKVTSAAFEEMTEQIRHGAGIKEAFTDFCVEIIENARIS